MNFMKKVLDYPTLGVIALGFMAPSIGGMVYDKIASMPSMSWAVSSFGGTYTKPISLAVLTGGLIYGASSMGLISNNTSVMAAGVATTMIAMSMLKDADVLSSIPIIGTSLQANIPSFNGIGGGRFGGYSGGYLGYLGDEHPTMGNEMLPQPVDAQLYGMGSSPQVNIF